MQNIHIERAISPARQTELGIQHWSIWEKNVSTFPWIYDTSETCYLIAGEVIVTPENGAAITICAGDLATFPARMKCTWQITSQLRKHYSFD